MEPFRVLFLGFVWLATCLSGLLFWPFALALFASSIGAALARAGWHAAAPGVASGFVVPGILGFLVAPIFATVLTWLFNQTLASPPGSTDFTTDEQRPAPQETRHVS